MPDLVSWTVDNCEVCFYAVKPLSKKVRPEKSTLKLVRPFGDSGSWFPVKFNAPVEFCDRAAVF
jgi:hypothetical protein